MCIIWWSLCLEGELRMSIEEAMQSICSRKTQWIFNHCLLQSKAEAVPAKYESVPFYVNTTKWNYAFRFLVIAFILAYNYNQLNTWPGTKASWTKLYNQVIFIILYLCFGSNILQCVIHRKTINYSCLILPPCKLNHIPFNAKYTCVTTVNSCEIEFLHSTDLFYIPSNPVFHPLLI